MAMLIYLNLISKQDTHIHLEISNLMDHEVHKAGVSELM